MSEDNGMVELSADRHVPGDSNVTDDNGSGPGNPNPLIPKGPRDLTRSRRVGLSRTVCTVCGAIKDQRRTFHKPGCNVHAAAEQFNTPRWRRERTGPIANNATSRDTGWS
jgi:hypothetical protein